MLNVGKYTVRPMDPLGKKKALAQLKTPPTQERNDSILPENLGSNFCFKGAMAMVCVCVCVRPCGCFQK